MQQRSHVTDNWIWFAVVLAAQTSWGIYPVLARYLQTVSQLPSMSILGFGNLLALPLVTALMWSRLDRRTFRSPLLLIFGLIVVGRGTTNFLAARYTLSIYVQLITQMTPFVVALLSTAVLGEKLPRYTGRAITLSLMGAVLMLSGAIGQAASPSGRNDWLGIGLALASTFLLAGYMIAVRRLATHQIPGETLWLVQLTALAVAGTTLSLLTDESWQAWTTLTPMDGIIFTIMVLGVFVGANAGQISAIRRLGAPLVSSTLAWRLVSALLLAALLLGERLNSVWQGVGAILVLATITWYLWQQR